MKKQNRNYKTLAGFFKGWGKANKCQDRVRPFTFSDYIRGYFPTFINGEYTQVYFHLSEDARAELFELMASAICSTKTAREKYADMMERYIGRDFGIFTRLWIRKEYRGTKLVGDYCAGQDWTAEVRCIQSLLRKGSF